jgi:glycosyltransferase involved in cell wall biosynthesis
LREWGRKLPLRAVLLAKNEGRSRARNHGWQHARGESVMFLDDDILLTKNALSAHAAAQARHPGVWLAEVKTLPEIVDSTLFEYLDGQGLAKCSPDGPVPARYFLTQNVSLPREALALCEGFDERFQSYGFEDMELAFRLESKARLEFHFLEGALGYHVHHHTLSEYLRKKRECGRSSLPLIARLHPQRLRAMQLDLLLLPAGELQGGRRALALALAQSFQLGGLSLALTALKSLGGVLPQPCRRRLYDYLVLASYAEGLAEEKLP